MRDIVVSEYGIADLRGESDERVVAAMLSITDSRFQDELLRRAKDAGKIARTYEIPPAHRENHPGRIESALSPLRASGLLQDFPFGSDFTPVEQRLIATLEQLQSAPSLQLVRLALSGLVEGEAEALVRMRLDRPATAIEYVYRALVRGALKERSGKSRITAA
jgi:hypothetical protein